MKETFYIGSGDVAALISKKESKAHTYLMQRFVSGIKPYYNAKASPIDALRIGAILEERYLLTLPDNYFTQYPCSSKEMDVFKCTLDFAKIEKGCVTDFDELKTVSLTDYIRFIEPIKEDNDALVSFVKKKHKNYYYQVQQQLYCSELDSCNLVFLSVYSYDDEDNYNRIIHPNEFTKVRIGRDYAAISHIKERGTIFQKIKDYYR